MNQYSQSVITDDYARQESLGYVGLLGTEYLSPNLTTPDKDGNRVTFININTAQGWPVVAWGQEREAEVQVPAGHRHRLGVRWGGEGEDGALRSDEEVVAYDRL